MSRQAKFFSPSPLPSPVSGGGLRWGIKNWNTDQAIQLQEKLRDKIILQAPFSSSKEIRTVAGTDLHFSPDEKEVTTSFAYTGIVVLSLPEMKVLERIIVKKKKVRKLFPALLIKKRGFTPLEIPKNYWENGTFSAEKLKVPKFLTG